MIHVIASIRIKEGKVSEYLEILKENVPKVRGEKGCIDYLPTVDINAELPRQAMDADMVTIIERWESMDALHTHLGAPHMQSYREKSKDLVESGSIKILQEA